MARVTNCQKALRNSFLFDEYYNLCYLFWKCVDRPYISSEDRGEKQH